MKNCSNGGPTGQGGISRACMYHLINEKPKDCYQCCDCGGPFAESGGLPVCTPLHASIVEQP